MHATLVSDLIQSYDGGGVGHGILWPLAFPHPKMTKENVPYQQKSVNCSIRIGATLQSVIIATIMFKVQWWLHCLLMPASARANSNPIHSSSTQGGSQAVLHSKIQLEE